MKALGALLRIFSYLFHLILCLFLGGVGLIAYLTPAAAFRTPLLPWEGDQLACALMCGAAVGLISLVLAVTGKFRLLFILWTLAVVIMMFRGFYLGAYTFDGVGEFKQSLWIFGASVLAFLGSLTRPKR